MSAAVSTSTPAPKPARARSPRPLLYRPTDLVSVRVPRMPVESFHGLAALPASGPLLPADPRVRAAISVGSPSLFERLARPDAAEDDPELRRKLHRYLVRMCTRATPFGLFAGVGEARWAAATDLAVVPEEARTRTRPDMEWLGLRLEALEARIEVRRHLRMQANPVAFVVGGRVVLSRRGGLDGAAHAGLTMRASSVVLRTLDLARRPTPYADLAAALLAASPGATPEKVETLLTQLWQSGILVTDLRPTPTAPNPVDAVLERLATVPPAAEARAEIARLADAARAWDALPQAARAEAFVALAGGDGGAEGARSRVQVDMALGLRGSTLNAEVGIEAARAAEILLSMSPSPRGLRYFAAYREAFLERYGLDREVPLLELTDPECGLAYALRRMDLSDEERDPVVLDIATRALYERRTVVTLDDATLKRLQTYELDAATAPPSIDVNVVVAAPSRADLDRGDFRLVVAPVMGSQAAGRMHGRFADLLPGTRDAIAATVRAEQALTPGALWAELVDVPPDAHGTNVVVRPAVTSHEIPIAACASVAPENVIPLRELVVGVRDDRFYVRWPQGNAELVVRSGHMLNPSACTTIAQFLFDVSRDGRCVFTGFQWGPAKGFPMLPRVQVGRIVLSLAQWRLGVADARRELRPQDPAAFPAAFAAWRDHWRVPRHATMGDLDHRLLLDLDEPSCVEEVRRELLRLPAGGHVEIKEGLPGVEDAWLEGDDGHYLCELSIALVQDAAKAKAARADAPTIPPPPPSASLPPRAEVVRPPGCEWLFFKVYTPAFLEEELLAGPVRKFARHMVERGLADEWFFVRYADPDGHVRLRFRGDAKRLTTELAPTASAWLGSLVDERVCTRFSVDTYDREVERYGGVDGMRIAERLFAVDSAAVAELLGQAPRAPSGHDRTDLAVRSVSDLLDAMGLDERGRLAWLESLGLTRCRVDFAAEYRRRRERLLPLLRSTPEQLAAALGRDAAAVLAQRAALLRPVGLDLADAAGQGRLTRPPAGILRSHVHMHCNRLFGIDPEAERRVYGLLLRAHESLQYATARPAGTRPPTDSVS